MNNNIKEYITNENSLIIIENNYKYYDMLENTNQKIIDINFKDLERGDLWNPLKLANDLYTKDINSSIELLRIISEYLIPYGKEEIDTFYSDNARNLFIGFSLYLFNTNNNVTISDIYNLLPNFNINDINETDISYKYLENIYKEIVPVIEAIKRVLESKLKVLENNDIIKNKLSKSNYDIQNIIKKSFIIYITYTESYISNILTSLFIKELHFILKKYNIENIKILLNDNLLGIDEYIIQM